jgi:AcrR family transcriptional regulator
MSAESTTRGRPRDETVDARIFEAVLHLIEEVGVRSVTIDAIAREAGVSKATIYRRWASKDDVIVDAIASLVTPVLLPETGDIREVLIAAMKRLQALLSSTAAGAVFPWLIGEIASGSEVGRRYAEAAVRPPRRLIATLIAQAIESGRLRQDLDVQLALDMVTGPVLLRRLLGDGEPVGEEFIDLILDAWAPRSRVAG